MGCGSLVFLAPVVKLEYGTVIITVYLDYSLLLLI
jgi:hypothetical protein